jgi:hypothetical protein
MPRLWLATDPVPSVPSMPRVTWWSQYLPPWTQRVTDRAVDEWRTEQLKLWDDRVRTRGNVPLQRVNAAGSTTRVISAGKVHSVPLPERVWVESATSDGNWFGVDPDGQFYYEAGQLGPVTLFRWLPAMWWNAYALRVYDLKQRWDSQPRSLTGGGLPMWPMVPSVEALDAGAGGVQHALHFVVSGGYSNEPFIAPARKTDGTRPAHPLRAGARLRLRPDAMDRLLEDSQGPHDAAVLWALHVYGCIVNDRTANVGHNLRLPADSRVNVTVPLRLTDLEVIV